MVGQVVSVGNPRLVKVCRRRTHEPLAIVQSESMVDATGELRAHFDSRAPSYAGDAPWVSEPRSLEPLAQLVAGVPGRRALEVGVGSGAVPGFLRARGVLPGFYVGVDLSAGMLQGANGWSPVQGDAAHLPFREGTVDLLVVRQAFHYFGRPPEVVAEFARVLTDAGTLVVAQITSFDDDADAAWWSRAVELRQPLRRHAWTASAIEAALRDGGFAVEAMTPIPGRSSLRSWLARYPIDEAVALELQRHYLEAPADVRRIRELEVQPDGDIHFAICWSILVGRHPGDMAQHAPDVRR